MVLRKVSRSLLASIVLICVLFFSCEDVFEKTFFVVTGNVYEIEFDDNVLPLNGAVVEICSGQPNIFFKCSESDTTDEQGNYQFNYEAFSLRPENISVSKIGFIQIDSVRLQNRKDAFDLFVRARPSYVRFEVRNDLVRSDSIFLRIMTDDKFNRNGIVTYRKVSDNQNNITYWEIASEFLEGVAISGVVNKSVYRLEVGPNKTISYSYQTFYNGNVVYEDSEDFVLEKSITKTVELLEN